MPDLIQDYFIRDLSDSELDELGRLIESRPMENDRFYQESLDYWEKLGLPQPPQVSSSDSPWKILGFLLLVSGLFFLLFHFSRKSPQLTETAKIHTTQLDHGIEPIKVMQNPRVGSEKPSPTSVISIPAAISNPSPRRHDSLYAIVVQNEKKLVTLRVLDSLGAEQRLLFAGILEAGTWRYEWDGRDERGNYVAPGKYFIETLSDGVSAKKTVLVGQRPQK